MRSALRGAPRRRCLPLLLLLLEATLCTAAVLDGRDRFDPLDSSSGGDEFYQVQDRNLYCKKCPAGTYVAEHCKEQYGSSKCLPCKEDEYIKYPNDFSKCLGCQMCREDQVELSPCRAVSNTQCVCKNGTFCSPDHPCEMCQKCRTRCPAGEVELAPCTPHSDLQCGPPTSTFSSLTGGMIVGIVVGVMACLAVLFMFLWVCCCRSRGDERDLSRKSCGVVDYLLRQLMRYQRADQGTQDNNHNEQVSQHQLLPRESSSVTPSAPGLEMTVPTTSCPSAKCRNLVPAQGKDPSAVLRRSFEIFAQEVPYKDWKRYGRALDLLENDIVFAEMNDKHWQEPLYQMLSMWQNRQGLNASVNTLLGTLHEINLGGIAEDIAYKLVQRGYFKYELSCGSSLLEAIVQFS
ncbi:tumor necrosis factor receptor superfamily member 10B isoform X1 [Balearica regulorum gibbericeps]|uniref:tumor necrosis factor receptor superfamily member 10B isoform X1 n=1 Tax=Balearica regulorum gibbericeps TaxID=100784 RepID=UPI003F620924